MITCEGCVHARVIEGDVRLGLGQENKEIVNALERVGFDLGEFCYCERLGFVESVIMLRDCGEWAPSG